MDKNLNLELKTFSAEKAKDIKTINQSTLENLIREGAEWMYNQLKDKLCACGENCGCKTKPAEQILEA